MKLLVANRGEIASRVFATARRLGWQTVAVYAEPDRDAPFLRDADEAICIGPAALDRSYLDMSAIVAAGCDNHADAVHPGYGFLSENAAFAQAVIDAGLVWVGPHPEAIAQMGAKIEARALAEAAGVPTIPGASDGDLAAAADQIGFPVLVKASAGGGGKGIRIVRSAGEFDTALSEARTEATRSFGDDRVIMERYISQPRHVEVQLIGDRHGNVVHLGTRDCSSQRRYQKLIEEAPAPNLPAATRDGLHDAAVALARHIGYDNAGTVEFIVDAASGEFFFLEMNTRLQVEHPVTEAVTGLDLVELQLRAATGQPLGLGQSDVTFTGHSIEARINAEDPYDDFSPRAGPVRHLSVPAGVRWDASVAEGSEVTPYYDPLIAKLIVTRPDRASALDALRDALDGLVVGPVPTNAGFLRWLTDMPALRSGGMTTNVIDALQPDSPTSAPGLGEKSGDATEPPGSGAMPAPPLVDDAAPVAAAAWLTRLRCQRAAQPAGPWSALGSFRLTEHRAEAAVLLRDSAGLLHEVSAEAMNGTGSDAPTGPTANDPRQAPPNLATASSANAGSVAVNIAGHTVTFEVPDRSDAWAPTATDDTGSVDAVAAPFPAVVVQVPVVIGDVVAAGDVVVVVEAMKMLHSLTAHGAGTVAEIRCSAGDAVEANQILVSFEQHGHDLPPDPA
ncbi:acetyl/propionyl/methylcrotonyl-CoA carboxylase subunit alpha [Candidatus Poriferisodalis sp.]|uniref:acetyl/propionyl/methylcrotonyl-CoA carboxylase subunit alpha n=1 Tax=Candidatus Poriferisodalis sp. TaxID=3101277 RepID=UPI003B01CF5A